MNRARPSLRTRLVVAFLLVALGVLALSYLAAYTLVRRSLQEHALQNLRARSSSLAQIVNDTELTGPLRRRIRLGLRLTDMRVVLVTPTGAVAGENGPSPDLPGSLSPGDIRPQALLSGQQVSGRRGNTVFLAIPTARTLPRGTPVVVATDIVETNALTRARPLLLLAGVAVLGVALAVSIWLARRLTRPIREIERAARQLASGDLTARAHIPPRTDDELAALAQTLNTMATQLEHARGSERAFLLSISHDLRTPLTSIRGYADALGDGTLADDDPDARARAASVIQAEARRLERLVRDLLDLSRLDSRQFSLRPRRCDATAVVRDAADAFAPKAHELGIGLDVRGTDEITVDVDPERLAQIVANLVENALKYATSTVEVYAAPHGPHHVAVVVTDDGPGIPASELGRVFDRLYTVRNSPGRTVGTGLGLAIVRELAAAMGGTAWGETLVDGGTRFVVSLPTNVGSPSRVG